MNEHSGAGRGRPRRAGVLAAAVAGTALLVAACGGGGSPAAAGKSGTYQKALAYAHCMRSHGVPAFSDPTSNGTISTSRIDLNSPEFSSARGACQYLQAGISFQLSPAQRQALLNSALKLAACMRAHGIADWPDPRPQDMSTSGGVIAIGIGPRGKTFASERNSPQFQSAMKACGQSGPGGGS